MQVVQLFHRENAEYNRFEQINRDHREAHVKGVFYYSVFFPVVELIVALTFALLVWYGAKGMLDGTVAFGEITAFILFINLFFRPVRAVADRFNNIQMGLVAVERIFKLMDETENREQDGTLDASEIKGEISFNHVQFSYDPSTPVLRDLSFHLEPGKTLAIVGPTGAGKTSIIGLLSRFYEYQEGQILLDGMPIESYRLDTLRNRIAVVLQDVFLFSGSVYDNMRMKDLAISEEKVAQVARAIGAYEFIEKLPGGFTFNVMERGSALSVGQRQLISFIRALSTDPAVIILDEATSSVDSETELLIQNAISTMLQGRTGIVIAHRLSTIKHADYIMVLDAGRCVQWGTHEQLLQQEGMYQSLYRSQFGMNEAED
jgi:ATP-binding cassette subfamily B protein